MLMASAAAVDSSRRDAPAIFIPEKCRYGAVHMRVRGRNVCVGKVGKGRHADRSVPESISPPLRHHFHLRSI